MILTGLRKEEKIIVFDRNFRHLSSDLKNLSPVRQIGFIKIGSTILRQNKCTYSVLNKKYIKLYKLKIKFCLRSLE